MAGRLGTARYDAVITDRAGRKLWQSGNMSMQSVSWEREYCETTSATVELTANPYVANQVEPWVHKLSIYRGDELVWHGIVRQVRASSSFLKVTAYDASVYFDYRRVGQPRHYFNRDAVTVAQDLVIDSFGLDDPLEVLDGLVIENSYLWMTMDLAVATTLVKDPMGDLVKQGFAWTVSAGRMILGPAPALHTTAQITDDHWSADVEVVKEGADCVNDVLVLGKGVRGYWADRATQVGVLQSIEKADSLVHEEDCVSQAKRSVLEAQYPPRQIVLPSSARLLPNAPVEINELIPGVRVPISSRQTGITVGSTMVIKKVTVSVDEKGENVSMTLMEPPSTQNTSLLPPPAKEDYNSPYDQERRDKEQTQTAAEGADADTGVGPA
ncbi:minor tail protein [Gordonia phage Soos]|nr:minor tail protein [Gordonia phage Soos]